MGVCGIKASTTYLGHLGSFIMLASKGITKQSARGHTSVNHRLEGKPPLRGNRDRERQRNKTGKEREEKTKEKIRQDKTR